MMYESIEPFGRKKRGRISKNVVIFSILLCTAGLLFFFLYKPSTIVVSPIPQENMFSFFLPILFRKKNPDELKKILIDTIQGTLPHYSIVVKDLHSDFLMSISADDVFTGTSVNKLGILGALYYLVQKGDIDLDKKITLQEGDIQDYGTGSIRYDAPGTTYTIRTLAHLMIQKSDNTAAFLLGRHVIGMDKIQKLIDSWGMAQTDMENNKTSNADMALLLEKIYREKVANHDLTFEMLSFLKDGTIEDRIPAQLPKDTLIYHKTGNGVGLLRDVGIVVGPKTTYYIGMFTSDVPNEEDVIQTLAIVSRTVYDFMK
ncbi:class A beta-lactamase-related serine hydrolase [Patescibacteria group bacterium]|nr:class A beta-lactamase-related serine hydrolase [Patescibacteria group bacterium]